MSKKGSRDPKGKDSKDGKKGGLRSKELLLSVTKKDLDIQTFTAGGPGGQHQNHSNTAVRIRHKQSGATGESREFRSQHQNMQAALRRMAESIKFKAWVNRQVLGEPPEIRVERDMAPENLLIMGHEDGRWKIID